MAHSEARRLDGQQRDRLLMYTALILALATLSILWSAYDVRTTGIRLSTAEGTGVVHGIVEDRNGTPLEGVEVSSHGTVSMSNSKGLYSIELPGGRRTLTFALPGYHTLNVSIFVIPEGGDKNRLDLTPESGMYMSGPNRLMYNTTAENTSQEINATAGVIIAENALAEEVVLAVNNGSGWANHTIKPGENITISGRGVEFRAYCPGRPILEGNASAGSTLIINDTVMPVLTPYSVVLAQPEDFMLCSTLLIVLAVFTSIGALAMWRGGPIMLGYVGAAAAALNLLSPYYLSQALGLLALALLIRHWRGGKE